MATSLERDAARLYVTYLRHLRHCPRSHLGPACSEGARLRRAWTATQWASLRDRPLPVGEGAGNT